MSGTTVERATLLRRKDVLAGLLFVAVALIGLYVSRDYPIGTAVRMGTGYVPRLLCWLLLGLGAWVLVQGFFETQSSLVIFGLSIERLGLVLSILLLIIVGAAGARGLRPFETVAAAVVLILLSWGIFIVGLGLAIPVWPDW